MIIDFASKNCSNVTVFVILLVAFAHGNDCDYGRAVDLRDARRLVRQTHEERQLLEGLREHSFHHSLPVLRQPGP